MVLAETMFLPNTHTHTHIQANKRVALLNMPCPLSGDEDINCPRQRLISDSADSDSFSSVVFWCEIQIYPPVIPAQGNGGGVGGIQTQNLLTMTPCGGAPAHHLPFSLLSFRSANFFVH